MRRKINSERDSHRTRAQPAVHLLRLVHLPRGRRQSLRGAWPCGPARRASSRRTDMASAAWRQRLVLPLAAASSSQLTWIQSDSNAEPGQQRGGAAITLPAHGFRVNVQVDAATSNPQQPPPPQVCGCGDRCYSRATTMLPIRLATYSPGTFMSSLILVSSHAWAALIAHTVLHERPPRTPHSTNHTRLSHAFSIHHSARVTGSPPRITRTG